MLKIKLVVYLLLVFLFSNVVLYGFGYGAKPAYAIALGLFLLCLQHRFLYGMVVTLLVLMSSVYYPVAILNGPLDENIVLSVLYTSNDEVTSYLHAIPVTTLMMSLLPLSTGVLCLVCKLVWVTDRVLPRKVMLIPLIIIMGATVKEVVKTGTMRMTSIHFPPVRFIADIQFIVKNILIEDAFYQSQKNKPTDFHPVIEGMPVETVMVVIGESARRDRMHLYGFGQPTTPYMDASPGTVFTDYISAGPTTPISLAHSLFKINPHSDKFSIALVKEGTEGENRPPVETHYDEDGRIEYNNSVVNLVKAAGYKTYWLSNQESHGKYDAPAAVAANQADYLFFARYGGIDTKARRKPLDSALTPEVVKTLSMPGRKVIFVHLNGSHPAACDRVAGKYETFYHSEEVSCYLQSIKNTDEQLHTFMTKLKETGKSWVFIYFADHGLLTKKYGTSSEYYIHGDKYKSNYNVPLFMATHEDTTRRYDNRSLSGFNLLTLIARAAHISDPALPDICQSVETCPLNRKVILKTGKYTYYNDLPSFDQ